jgi:hypothetical protein
MISGVLDHKTVTSLSPAARAAQGWTNSDASKTNYCPIFPPSTNRGLNPEQENHAKVRDLFRLRCVCLTQSQTVYAGNAGGFVLNYGGIDALVELDGPKIHRLSNGLTLCTGLHGCLDDLSLWFEEVPVSPF